MQDLQSEFHSSFFGLGTYLQQRMLTAAVLCQQKTPGCHQVWYVRYIPPVHVQILQYSWQQKIVFWYDVF